VATPTDAFKVSTLGVSSGQSLKGCHSCHQERAITTMVWLGVMKQSVHKEKAIFVGKAMVCGGKHLLEWFIAEAGRLGCRPLVLYKSGCLCG